MPHSAKEKQRLRVRLRRMRGQLEALERALEAGSDCSAVLQQIAAIRGAVNGLMAEVLESHLREELGGLAQTPESEERRQAGIDEAIALVRSYLK